MALRLPRRGKGGQSGQMAVTLLVTSCPSVPVTGTDVGRAVAKG